METPPHETGRVPVHYEQAEPHYYGITPTTLVLALATAVLGLAIVLFVIGHWALGLVALGISILLGVFFVEGARRRPDPVARTTAEALDSFRSRATVATESLATRGRAARQLLVLRRELQRMASLRTRLLFELGDAVYRGDEQATGTARGQLEELDALTARREKDMQAVVAGAREEIRQRKLEVQPTEMVELPERPGEDPGAPAVIPEPYPPPDEGTPPEPAIIPEPGPAVIPEPGPLGPEEDADSRG
jgi:type IV secretory pathway TrbD component